MPRATQKGGRTRKMFGQVCLTLKESGGISQTTQGSAESAQYGGSLARGIADPDSAGDFAACMQSWGFSEKEAHALIRRIRIIARSTYDRAHSWALTRRLTLDAWGEVVKRGAGGVRAT